MKKQKILSIVTSLFIMISFINICPINMQSNAVSDKVLEINWDNIRKVGTQRVSGPCACYRQHRPETWQADTLFHECKCGEVCGADRG